MFNQNELSVAMNETVFQLPVQYYVDVLNLMTDTVLTSATYAQQFYLELDKGQLFRTLGNPTMAKYIYDHLDDCELDSTQQKLLNNWLYSVESE